MVVRGASNQHNNPFSAPPAPDSGAACTNACQASRARLHGRSIQQGVERRTKIANNRPKCTTDDMAVGSEKQEAGKHELHAICRLLGRGSGTVEQPRETARGHADVRDRALPRRPRENRIEHLAWGVVRQHDEPNTARSVGPCQTVERGGPRSLIGAVRRPQGEHPGAPLRSVERSESDPLYRWNTNAGAGVPGAESAAVALIGRLSHAESPAMPNTSVKTAVMLG